MGPRGNPATIILLKKCSNKMISMTLYCAHRCVSFSLNIREASSYSKWEQMPKPTAGQCAGALNPDEMSPSNPSPQSSGDPVEEEAERV